MKKFTFLLAPRFAMPAARFLKVVCYVVMAFMLASLLLSVLGRLTFTLYSPEGNFERAIYAEDVHGQEGARSLLITIEDQIRITANRAGGIDFATHLGLCLIAALQILPVTVAYWFLSRLFDNIGRGEFFVRQNAHNLLYYGLLEGFAAVCVPFLKLFAAFLVNLVTESSISLATGANMLQTLMPSIAFLVAASIIEYGISLQDEVDHTL